MSDICFLRLFLGCLNVFCETGNKIVAKYWLLSCIHGLLYFFGFHFLYFLRLLLNEWFWLLLSLVVYNVIDVFDYFCCVYFFLWLVLNLPAARNSAYRYLFRIWGQRYYFFLKQLRIWHPSGRRSCQIIRFWCLC